MPGKKARQKGGSKVWGRLAVSDSDNVIGLFGRVAGSFDVRSLSDGVTSWTRHADRMGVIVEDDLPELQIEAIQMIQLWPLGASVHDPEWAAFGAYPFGDRGNDHHFLPGIVMAVPASIG